MYTVRFKDVYSSKERKINTTSPELRFMQSICQGKTEAGSFFNEMTTYRKRVFLDAPNGRFDGVEDIQRFADQWLADFEAKSAVVYPVIQTIANGRAVSEIEVWFELFDGEIKKVPMVVFADLAGQERMEGMRIYYFFKFLKNAIAYRKPIFRPRFHSWTEPPLLTDVVRYYYEQLHNFRTAEAVDNIIGMTTDDVLYGGYRPEEEEPLFQGQEAIRKVYEGICHNCPRAQYIRFETIVDDGVNCAVEWTMIVRKSALVEGFISIAGCAIYERDQNCKLRSIRICDNSGYDQGLDLNSIPEHDMFID